MTSASDVSGPTERAASASERTQRVHNYLSLVTRCAPWRTLARAQAPTQRWRLGAGSPKFAMHGPPLEGLWRVITCRTRLALAFSSRPVLALSATRSTTGLGLSPK